MSVLRLFFLLGACLAATAMAREVTVSASQLAALEKLLAGSELEDQVVEFDDSIDDDETRMWNPLTWLKNKLRNKCLCEGNVCQCCFKLAVFSKSACFKAEVQADKKLRVDFEIDDRSLVSKSFDIQRNDEVCGKVPVAPLNFLNFCFNQQSEVDQDGTITYCSHVQFKVANNVGAVIQFKCLQYKNGELTFNGYKEVEKTGMLVMKAKNPFKAAIALYKQAAGQS